MLPAKVFVNIFSPGKIAEFSSMVESPKIEMTANCQTTLTKSSTTNISKTNLWPCLRQNLKLTQLFLHEIVPTDLLYHLCRCHLFNENCVSFLFCRQSRCYDLYVLNCKISGSTVTSSTASESTWSDGAASAFVSKNDPRSGRIVTSSDDVCTCRTVAVSKLSSLTKSEWWRLRSNVIDVDAPAVGWTVWVSRRKMLKNLFKSWKRRIEWVR